MVDLNKMFHSITGKWPEEVEPRLLRTPRTWLPRTTGVRYYAAHFLPKINDRLLAQSPEKDVAMLRKLQESKYDTEVVVKSEGERSRDYVRKVSLQDKRLREFKTTMISKANDDTDWHVIKAPGRYRTGRKK
jgi:hypothetical protein